MQINNLSKINFNSIFKHDMSLLDPHVMGGGLQMASCVTA
jgi:hypothetical protein